MILSKTTLAISAAAAFVGANMRFILDGKFTAKKYGQDLAGGFLSWSISVLIFWMHPSIADDPLVLIGVVILVCFLSPPLLKIGLAWLSSAEIKLEGAGVSLLLKKRENPEVSAEAVGITIVSKGHEQNDTTGSSSH